MRRVEVLLHPAELWDLHVEDRFGHLGAVFRCMMLAVQEGQVAVCHFRQIHRQRVGACILEPAGAPPHKAEGNNNGHGTHTTRPANTASGMYEGHVLESGRVYGPGRVSMMGRQGPHLAARRVVRQARSLLLAQI